MFEENQDFSYNSLMRSTNFESASGVLQTQSKIMFEIRKVEKKTYFNKRLKLNDYIYEYSFGKNHRRKTLDALYLKLVELFIKYHDPCVPPPRVLCFSGYFQCNFNINNSLHL
ncbi:hypothetical protein CWI39_2846p0010 [Hamiltosporidium magnivora]|uniref:Uncharacterized protein n=1 Tax=Hamiltosporidium magnivora TaxID=148818 RepID=A0A4Q9KSA0_9MICR|nr:hypothetical protein CWI39_2846p0010 [Hamiltosporidium magnivora]